MQKKPKIFLIEGPAELTLRIVVFLNSFVILLCNVATLAVARLPGAGRGQSSRPV